MKKSTASFEPWLDVFIISKTRTGLKRIHTLSQPSRSFLKQWTQIQKARWSNGSESNTKSTTGVLTSSGNTAGYISAPAANSVYGLLLGTGTSNVAIDDYKLETQINQGSGAGQLDHKAVTFDAHEVVAGVSKFKIRRQFENLSGSTITVTEAGLYQYYNTTYYFCVLRDKFVAPQDILNGQILEVRITFKATA